MKRAIADKFWFQVYFCLLYAKQRKYYTKISWKNVVTSVKTIYCLIAFTSNKEGYSIASRLRRFAPP